MNVFYLIADIH